MRQRLRSRLPLLIFVVFLLCSWNHAEARWSFTPRLYLEEQYDDNLFLTETNEEDDFVTTLSPGLDLKYESPTALVDLDYEYRGSYYRDFPELDFGAHRGLFNARKDFGPRLSAGIREFFLRSEDPIELTGIPIFERPSSRPGTRNRYSRNIVVPEATFTFRENRSLRVTYRNEILRNDDRSIADLDENTFNALLDYRINIHHGFEVFYEFLTRDYGSTVPSTLSRDHDGNEVRGRYTYYLGPRTSAFVEYRYYQRDFEVENPGLPDFEVHRPSLGFSRQIREDVSLIASGGYALRKAEGRDNEDTFYGRGDLIAQYKRLALDVYAETGFDEDFVSAQSLGFNDFWRAGFNGRYQLGQRLWADGFFFFEDDDFVDLDRRDKLWSVRAGLSYQVLKWLFLSFDYTFNKRDSNIAFQSYTDNRFFGRVTARYDVTDYF